MAKNGQAGTQNSREIVPRKGGFEKGHPRFGGCKKGSKNLFTMQMKDAILHAMELAGKKNKNEETGEYNLPGEGGLKGYMLHLALNNEQVFCHAFASKLLPTGIDDLLEPANEVLSEDEARALCLKYGISFEKAAEAEIRQPTMIDVASVGK
jgi:hypothetical protein